MKLYNSIGPNPHVVRMFLAEKGVSVPFVELDLRDAENRREPYLSKNPAGQTPALELDDGQVISQITAICEYLDEIHPNPPLIGVTPEERANTRMWVRRIDLGIVEPIGNGFRFSAGLPMFQDRMRCIPQAADDLKLCAADQLAWLDGQISGRQFVAGDKITLADILLFCFIEFGAQVGQPLDPANRNISAWRERMKSRPSVAASARPAR